MSGTQISLYCDLKEVDIFCLAVFPFSSLLIKHNRAF